MVRYITCILLFSFTKYKIFAYEISRDAKLQSLMDNLADDPKLYPYLICFTLSAVGSGDRIPP